MRGLGPSFHRLGFFMSAMLHGKHFLAGTHRGSEHTTTAISPLTGAALPGHFSIASPADVDAAMQAAAEAFPAFAATTGQQRAVFLERIAEEILAIGDTLLERAHLETALPLPRLTGERGRTVGQLRLFAEAAREAAWVDARIDRAQPDREPLARPDLRRMKHPLGPVVVFGSSNFPLAFSVAGGPEFAPARARPPGPPRPAACAPAIRWS
jgi:NADP-dependent aldehyde dehydrogenase